MTTVVDIADIFALSTNVGYYAEGVLFILIDLLYLIEQCFCCYTAASKVHSPNLLLRKCMSEVGRIGSKITFHLRKLWKAKFSILCDVIFLVSLQGKFEIDHS